VRLLGLNGSTESRAALPLAEVEVTGHGRVGTPGKRHVDSAVGARLRYEHHGAEAGHLAVHLRSPETELRVAIRYLLTGELPAVRCWSELTAGSRQVRIESVSSFVLGGVASLLGARTWWQH
jgi:alpha-galactosidase